MASIDLKKGRSLGEWANLGLGFTAEDGSMNIGTITIIAILSTLVVLVIIVVIIFFTHRRSDDGTNRKVSRSSTNQLIADVTGGAEDGKGNNGNGGNGGSLPNGMVHFHGPPQPMNDRDHDDVIASSAVHSPAHSLVQSPMGSDRVVAHNKYSTLSTFRPQVRVTLFTFNDVYVCLFSEFATADRAAAVT